MIEQEIRKVYERLIDQQFTPSAATRIVSGLAAGGYFNPKEET